MDLTILNRARTAIARAATVDEAKLIRDKAEALRVYVKQAKCAGEMERQCVVIRLRAETHRASVVGHAQFGGSSFARRPAMVCAPPETLVVPMLGEIDHGQT